MRCGCGNRYSTNNVNVCINVTKIQGGGTSQVQIAALKSQVSGLTVDVQLLSGDLYNLSGQISSLLSGSFTATELTRLKNLATDGNYMALTGCIARYDTIENAVYKINFKQKNDPEQELIAPAIDDTTDFINVSATITNVFTGDTYQMGSIKDGNSEQPGGDNDNITQAFVKVSGFILGSWINPVGETNQDINSENMEYFGTNALFYNHNAGEGGESSLFLTRNQVKNIYNQRGKIMKICALKIKNKGE